jgi:glutamate-ammonia-ligase adenylyltransferase
MRLRPTGQSGSLVVPLGEFRRYFASGGAQVWERQSLTRARPVFGDPALADVVMATVREAMLAIPWGPGLAREIRSMRERLEATAPPRSLKRGPGGMTDVEFLVQAFQLRLGRDVPAVCRTNTWESLGALFAAGHLSEADHATLTAGYSFHRLAEARLRIVTNRPLTEYPEAPAELEKLARRMGIVSDNRRTAGERFLRDLAHRAQAVRDVFDRLVRA